MERAEQQRRAAMPAAPLSGAETASGQEHAGAVAAAQLGRCRLILGNIYVGDR